MLKQEFERLVGYEVSDSEYRVIECCYMAAGDDVQKEEFCKEWKEGFGKNQMFLKIVDNLTDDRSKALLGERMKDEILEKMMGQLTEHGLKWNDRDEMIVEIQPWERIKTLEDAEKATGMKFDEGWKSLPADVQAYLRLMIVCAAINGLDEKSFMDFPKFERGEYVYWPWFWFYESKEAALDDGYEEDCIMELPALVGGASNGDSCGVSPLNSYNVASHSNSDCGGALVLRDRDRAIYCGKQFMADWLTYYTKREVKK